MPDTALEQSSSALPGTHTEHASRHADSAHVGRRRTVVGVILIAGLALFLRAGGVDRQGLWADELFSLAIATGHSLEHPASKADLTLGDYVEAPHPLPVPHYQSYLQHEVPPAGPARVLRAVLLSDTNPPLYYLLLWGWTLAAGTGDAALRLFSVVWALACFPFIWLLAKQIGGRPAIFPACLLFSLSPLSLYYSTEGRMYSLMWFLAVCLAWLTLKLNQHGPRLTLTVPWVLTGAAGLLTHYFYVFVLAACWGWLLLHPGRFARRHLTAVTIGVGLLISPWYVKLPESLTNWRITDYWLYMPSGSRTHGAITLPLDFVSTSGVWGRHDSAEMVIVIVLALLGIAASFKLAQRIFSERRRLIWLWLAAACAGPVLFDALRGTYTTLVPRYALAGLPAALLIVAFALARLRPALRVLCMGLIVVAWLPGIRDVLSSTSRSWEPSKQVAAALDHHAGDDVIIIHSIPSGVLGVTRYLEKPADIFSWVGQLKQRRVPEDIQALAGHGRRIVLVKMHAVGEPAPQETWLRDHAELTDRLVIESAEILYFVPTPVVEGVPDGTSRVMSSRRKMPGLKSG